MEHKPLPKTKLKELSLELPKEYQKVNCPSCQTAIPAEDLNIHDKIGKCSQCDALFHLHDHIANLERQLAKPQQTILRPEGIDVFQFKSELELSFKKPFSGWLIPAILIFPFVAFMFTLSYITKGTIPIMLPIVFWIPALLFIYRAVVRATTRISIDQQLLTIHQLHRINTNEVTYPIEEIDQLYIKKLANNAGYTLNAIINGKDGSKHVKLVPHLKSHSKAMYLEQVIERHLGIIDREVTATT